LASTGGWTLKISWHFEHLTIDPLGFIIALSRRKTEWHDIHGIIIGHITNAAVLKQI
jgi:hypothetical protein